jgi:hypothetical protein
LAAHTDHCTRQCLLAQCPDADGDKNFGASDSQRILRRAVDSLVDCPLAACDVDSDGKVGTLDALMSLRNSVSLPAPGICAAPAFWPPRIGEVAVSIGKGKALSMGQLQIRYNSPFDIFDDPTSELPACEGDSAFANSVFYSEPGFLQVFFVSSGLVTENSSLFHCNYFGTSPGTAAALELVWDYVIDANGSNLYRYPEVFAEYR